jgi:hypothetical protein
MHKGNNKNDDNDDNNNNNNNNNNNKGYNWTKNTGTNISQNQ